MDLKIGLLGGGSWGTTVASMIARKRPVKMWARNPDTVADINNNHRNEKYLPGANLTPSLVATNSIEEAIYDAVHKRLQPVLEEQANEIYALREDLKNLYNHYWVYRNSQNGNSNGDKKKKLS